jgi:hypothetical protein
MKEKQRDKPAGKTPPADRDGNDPGRLGVDDLGNITWEWKDEGGLLADDTLGAAERVRALVDPSLDIEPEDGGGNPLKVDPKRLKSGYNPYNSGALGKQSWKKKKDLRELSKWIELRKKIATKKDEG